MTPELVFVREEIQELNDRWADVQMLDSLANNIVYILSKLQKSNNTELLSKHGAVIGTVISEVLNTINKELRWARDAAENDPERQEWFRKAKQIILQDIECLFV